ncbi:MAG TPA: hypothetical protein VMB50_17530 [Myxococcales bacterium]|nr:hypothetical protein [Myxococcales bacterium]
MSAPNEGKLDEAGRIAVRAALHWSGWGSPVGLGLFLVSLGLLAVCLHLAGVLH